MSYKKLSNKIRNDVGKSKKKHSEKYNPVKYMSKEEELFPHTSKNGQDYNTPKEFFQHVQEKSKEENPRIKSQNTFRRLKKNVYVSNYDADITMEDKGGSTIQTEKMNVSKRRRESKKKILGRSNDMNDRKSRMWKENPTQENQVNEIDFNSNLKYESFLPMNKMWFEYIRKINVVNQNGSLKNPQFLVKTDYNGAILEVVKSKCVSYVGVKGICIKETENSYILIDKENEVRMILKRGTVFQIELEKNNVQLIGDKFLYRPFVRSAKKFK